MKRIRFSEMKPLNRQLERLDDDLTVRMLVVCAEQHILQEEIASELGVHQTTVSRWASPDHDLLFPAALIPALNTERLRPLGLEILRYCAERYGLSLVPTAKPKRKK